MARRFAFIALLTSITLPASAAAQKTGPYVGASISGLSHLDSVGSSFTRSNGGVTFGAAAPRLIVEFEASFGGSMSSEYSYACCGGHDIVRVVTSTRDSFFLFQLKARGHVFEPVAGFGYVQYRVTRHATATSAINPSSPPRPYFDDGHWDGALVATGGLDAAVMVSKHLYFVPSARLIVSLDDSTAVDLHAGRLRLRYGAGVRIVF